MRDGMKRHGLPDLETVALQGLSFLAEDPERLLAFLAANGADISDVRALAPSPGFQAAVLEHLVSDERLLLPFADDAGYAPEVLAGLHDYLTNHAHAADD